MKQTVKSHHFAPLGPQRARLTISRQGMRAPADKGKYAEAKPFLKRAVELDPNFALAMPYWLKCDFPNKRSASFGHYQSVSFANYQWV